MKIEIGESLMLSYFKHIKKCHFYQLNWKISSNWVYSTESYENALSMYNKILQNTEFSDIFKKSEFSQLIKQSEIDIIGMDSDNKIYVADIAFHESGLSYGGKIETKDRVFKKILRSYLALLTYFPNRKYEIIFASPKVNPATEDIIKEYLEILNRDFIFDNVAYTYISNENFKTEILIPTLNAIRDDSDTTELFGRAFKLLDMFKIINENKSIPIRQPRPVRNPNNGGNNPSQNIILEFIPSDEKVFKEKLIEKKFAKRTFYFDNNKEEIDTWDASRFTKESNLRGNIWSSSIVKNKGLRKIKFEIL
jgi:hypothetical protein